jgi:hypothetical protein
MCNIKNLFFIDIHILFRYFLIISEIDICFFTNVTNHNELNVIVANHRDQNKYIIIQCTNNVTMIISGPGSPANLNIAIINTTSMYITWSPPSQSNGVITQYLVGYYRAAQNASINVSGRVTSVVLSKLHCWVEYTVCVSASTSYGYGQNICQSGITNQYGKYNLCIIVVQRLLKIHAEIFYM